METKCIKKIYRPLENELKKFEKHLKIVLDEINSINNWIYIENKKIIINRDQAKVIVNSLYYNNSNVMYGVDVEDIKKQYKEYFSFEGFNTWTIPNLDEIKRLVRTSIEYPNKTRDVEMKFKDGIRAFLLCDDMGKTARYRIESPGVFSGPASIFPIIRIEPKNVFGVLKFILDNKLIIKNFKNKESLNILTEFNSVYPLLCSEFLKLDRDKIYKDLKEGSLKYIFKNNIEDIYDEFLNYDKRRIGIEGYDKKLLEDINRGDWDLYKYEFNNKKESDVYVYFDKEIVARNPMSDIKENGIVAIDFGTKSTVVVYQEKNEHSIPMRIGVINFKSEVLESQYENPTVMEFIDIDNFLKSYNLEEGRPETKWGDLTISHTANNELLNNDSFDYYSYMSDLKMWCGSSDRKVRIIDKKGLTIDLPNFIDIKEGEFNPIEIYAYYIGSYINNMQNGIYLEYILSFPVTYDEVIKNKIIECFKRGISKSLPEIILKNRRIKVVEGASEPAAYAISALKSYGFEQDENENIYYGVFDFGGGTTDFDYGLYRIADDDKEDRFDYVIEHFGAGGDRYLGGENLLELLAFNVFKDNANLLRKEEITFTLPSECNVFVGSEILIKESKEARLNMRQLMESLRAITEHHKNYKEKYKDGIKLDFYKNDGTLIKNIKLNINLNKLENILEERIRKGIFSFFESLNDSFKAESIENVKKINILLAGNSSRSQLVNNIFKELIKEKNDIKYDLYPPLRTEASYKKLEELSIKFNRDDLEKPTGKTGVAFGLIESRGGGSIKVINRENKFKYFVGRQKRKNFKLVLDKNIKFNKWVKFIDASEENFEIYYTTLPIARGNNLSTTDLERLRLEIEKTYDDANIYIRAVGLDKIEYVVSRDDMIKECKYLSEIVQIKLD